MLDARPCSCGHTLFSIDAANGEVVCANWRCGRVIGRLADSVPPPGPPPQMEYSDMAKKADDMQRALMDHAFTMGSPVPISDPRLTPDEKKTFTGIHPMTAKEIISRQMDNRMLDRMMNPPIFHYPTKRKP